MNCREAGTMLSPYLDGELDARRREKLEDHVAGCASCAAELATLRRAVQLLAAPKTLAQPEGLLVEFKQRLAAETPPPRRFPWSTPWSWSLAGLTVTAAAAGLIVSLHGNLIPPPRSAAIQQVAQQPNDLKLQTGAPGATAARARPNAPTGAAPKEMARAPLADETGLKSSPTATSPGPQSGQESALRGLARRDTPSAAPPPHPIAAPVPGRDALSRDVEAPAPPPSSDRVALREAGEPRPFPSRVATNAPIAELRANEGPMLADKGRLPGLKAPPTETKKAETRARRQSLPAELPPGGAPAVRASAEADSRSAPAGVPLRRAESGATKPTASAGAAGPEGATRLAAANAPRLEVTVHRPYPDAAGRASGAGPGAAGGACGFAAAGRGGAGAPAPPAGPAAPGALAGGGAGSVAAGPSAVGPELAAAMRVPVDVKVANVTLLGLTDRLAAEAAVAIVVDDPIVREMRVTAELTGVPLYRALESVAIQANLVIAPRPGGVTLQLREPSQPAQGERGKQDVALGVWSPAWGTLPRTGFGVPLAQSSNASNRDGPNFRARPVAGVGSKGNTAAVAANKENVRDQRRSLASEEALAPQNQQVLQKAASQLDALNAQAALTACPRCHRPLSAKASYLCPKCKRPVKATDLKCAACGEPTPAHCPHCGQALVTPLRAK